ncbi:hypothetical protein Tco_0567415 [Tanacetum coccineum]
MGLWYPKDSGFELKAFADADYAGCHDTRRSTSGSAQFLGHRLVSWSSKKQKSTAISTRTANTSPYQMLCSNPLMRSHSKTYGFAFTKFRLILWNAEERNVVPPGMKFSEEEWDELTKESTRHVVAQLASSPEFTLWDNHYGYWLIL